MPVYGKSNLNSQSIKLNEGKTLMQRYKHKQLNTLYVVEPKTQNIYILDFKKQSFVRENIISQMLMPSAFTTVQQESGRIILVGGLIKDIVMKSTYSIDENLHFSELASMKQCRFGAPAALLHDKYVLVAGGHTNG